MASVVSLTGIFSSYPYLAPNFADLRSECLLEDMRNYRGYHASRIFSALHHGMNGIEATREFSLVNHYIAGRLAADPLIKCGNELISTLEFFDKHQLSAVLVGGTANLTMGPHSDFDMLVVADRPEFLKAGDSEIMQGLKKFRTCLMDTLRSVGLAETAEPLIYAPQFLHDDVKDESYLQLITGTLSASLLFGSQDTFNVLQNNLDTAVRTHRQIIVEYILNELKNRHAKYDYHVNQRSPDLKESPGFLRDIDNIRWLKSVVTRTEGEAAAAALLKPDEEIALNNASSIFLQLKYLKHFHTPDGPESLPKRVNILSPRYITAVFQPFAAIVTPERDQGRAAYQLLYEQAANVSDILSRFIERIESSDSKLIGRELTCSETGREVTGIDMQGNNLLQTLRRLSQLSEDLLLNPAGKLPVHRPSHVRTDIAMIKQSIAAMPDDVFKLSEACQAFLNLFAGADMSRGMLLLLHETGVLQRFIPCFSKTINFREIGTYLDDTLDHHCIAAASGLQSFFSDYAKTGCSRYRDLKYLENRRELLFALLLHDVGKKEEDGGSLLQIHKEESGRHEVIGASLAAEDLIRLGLPVAEAEVVRKLIRYHSLLPMVANGLLSNDANELTSVAEIVGNQEFLDMLYVHSWLDKSTSNQETFTPLKQGWLNRTYERLSDVIAQGSARAPETDSLVLATLEERFESDRFSVEKVLEHLNGLPERYRYECPAATVASHLRLIEELIARSSAGLGEEGVEIAWIGRTDVSARTAELAVVGRDKIGLFRDVAHALYSRQLDIEEAHVFTRRDGLACNVFTVRPLRAYYNLAGSSDIRTNELKALQNLLANGATEIQPKNFPGVSSESPFSMPLNVRCSISEGPGRQVELCIECNDRPGLAYLIGDWLAQHRISIVSARLHAGNRGLRNLFQIKGAGGDEIELPQRKWIERELTGLLATR